MVTEPISISIKDLAAPAQARLPSDKGIARKGKEYAKAENGPDLSRMMKMVADVQEDLSIVHKVDLQFRVHEASGQIMVTITEASTGEVIREVPASEILNLAAKMDKMTGVIFDQEG